VSCRRHKACIVLSHDTSYNVAGAAYDRSDVSEAIRYYERVLFLSGSAPFPSLFVGRFSLSLPIFCLHAHHFTTETYTGSAGGGNGASKAKDKSKDSQQKKISQMSVAAKLNLSSLYLKMNKAVQACKL
jgi:hypothetical protein